MENIEIARMLAQTADLMEIAGEDPFRIRSYRNAAAAIEGFPERVADIACNPARKVTEISGVGKGLAAVVCEILSRGSFDKRDELVERYPPTALEMLNIQGLGPKSIALIIEHFRVTSLEDLERLCNDQKLRTLPRMGAKLEDKVLRSIAAYRQSAGRFLLRFAMGVADELKDYFSDRTVEAAGSLRRGKESVGDLDLLVCHADPEPVLDRFVKHSKVSEVLAKGENKASVKFGLEGIQVDMRVLPPQSYGAAMQYFTGSKTHNVILRQRALRRGLTLNEYGLFELEGNARMGGATEQEIYERLGLDWIPPEMREAQGEIEAAEQHRLPRLIELSDIRGDLHMHTRETDGRASLAEMAECCQARGYEYIAITDHSKALAMANGLDEARVIAFAEQVRHIDHQAAGIRIFSGLECDIRRDGSMDIDDDALAALDFVVASVHSFMNLEPAEMTDRLLRAVENRYVRVLGHPTGRMLFNRDGYKYDFEAVATAAAHNNVALEVNSSPERLDLYDPLLRAAKAKGCKFTISTDAHHPKHLANMRYGVLTARRGWLQKEDVLNTLPVNQFAEAIRR
ncbi:MAG: DNA polymerase/3'-5' exonuclease PolX [Bryobacterales bacterium]|nr:DNA polymerase/3'-5' exonuclease PolX [Bryobacterales bacterium]